MHEYTHMSRRIFTAFFLIYLTSNCHANSELHLIDSKTYHAFPQELLALASQGLAKDTSGLIGRNRKWGRLYSPRFQLGAGRALRITLAAGDIDKAQQAYLAIKAGTRGIESNGYIRSTLPIFISLGRKLSESDIASAGAFYLGDACLGIIALEAVDFTQAVAESSDLHQIKKSLRHGIQWLISQRERLLKYDSHAPNRLLFDALAFHACGILVNHKTALQIAPDFIQRAIQLQNSKGYFLEGGGWDTSYQAVSISVGKDVLLAGVQSPELESALYKATQWLARRINDQGRVDSTGNKRTCEGGESFLNKPKLLALDSVFISLAYLGIMKQDHELLDSAKRVSNWYQKHPRTNPCFSETSLSIINLSDK